MPTTTQNPPPPGDPARFFEWLRHESEAKWKDIELKDEIYGFQVQAGTRWNPGLAEGQIAQFEGDMGFAFPRAYKLYLGAMNGTAKETINIYGRSGEPTRFAPGYYAYPKDLPRIREMIDWIYESFNVTPAEVEERQLPHIMPIVGHRFLVIDRCKTNPVLSMYGDDVIPYAPDLMSFLYQDIFHEGAPGVNEADDIDVDFWLG